MNIDFTKEITTRDGRAVEIFKEDAGGDYPIIGRIRGANGADAWSKDGKYTSEDMENLDLINVPEKKKVIKVAQAVYESEGSYFTTCRFFKSEEQARFCCLIGHSFIKWPASEFIEIEVEG